MHFPLHMNAIKATHISWSWSYRGPLRLRDNIAWIFCHIFRGFGDVWEPLIMQSILLTLLQKQTLKRQNFYAGRKAIAWYISLLFYKHGERGFDPYQPFLCAKVCLASGSAPPLSSGFSQSRGRDPKNNNFVQMLCRTALQTVLTICWKYLTSIRRSLFLPIFMVLKRARD